MPSVDRYALVDGSYQHSLLRDRARLAAYSAAIRSVVRPGDVVADLGSGSGVLAALAVRAGAARVFAVEAHGASSRRLETLVESSPFRGRVLPVQADAEGWVPPGPVDVVLAELMETGLLHEPMAATMRNVHAWPRRPRAVVPRAAELLVEGVEVQDVFEGFHAPLPGFRGEGSGEAVTDAACYLAPDFGKEPPPEGVDARLALRAQRDGTAHALRLRTRTEVAPGQWLEPSPAHCTPVVLPLPEPLAVRKGHRLEAAMRYTFAFDERPIEYGLR